jgi:glycosyltransferase involved in cell wall biosynthesis
LRVLHIINSLGLGGAETLLYRLAARPSDTEHEVVALGKRDWYSSRLEERGIVVHHLEMTSLLSFARDAGHLIALIRKSRADVVQTWMYRSNVVGGLSARAVGTPVVWGIHCSSFEALRRSSRLMAYLSGALARWVPDFIVNCSTRSAELHARIGYRSAPGAVIHNGYDGDVFRRDDLRRAETREFLGIPPDTFAIGTIGRWHPQKGIPILLEAVRIVSERGASVRCLLVGRDLGLGNSELAELIKHSGCDDLVQPLGERADVPDLGRALDLHVLASIGSEAFPNVVGETMLCATPNVVTDVGDSALIVGNTGWVVPPRNAKRLAAAIERAWNEWRHDPARWESRRSAARQRICEQFTEDRMAAAYEDVWRRVAATA